MKAKKSLIITLFAAMMIFALGATAAFAAYTANSGEWNADYTSVKVSSDGVAPAVEYKEIEKIWSDGLVVATLDVNAYKPALPYSETAKYYDLANAEIKGATTWSYAAFTGVYDKDKATLNTTDLVLTMKDGISKTAKDPVAFGSTEFKDNYELTYNVTGFDPENKAQQTVTVTAALKAKGTGDTATKNFKRLVGTIPAKTITVQAKPVNWYDMQIACDTIKADSPTVKTGMVIPVEYDGTEHTVVTSDVEGWTPSFEIQNETTGAYEPATSVKIKDVGTVNFKLTLTPAATTEKVQTIYASVEVKPAKKLEFGFKFLSYDATTHLAYVLTGTDPWDYVQAEGVAESDTAEALAFFKEKYTIEVKEAANNPAVKVWSIEKNKDFDETAAAKTYKVLLKNYAMVANGDYATGITYAEVMESADPALDPNTKADEVTITFAPNKVTYKAKKLKKKAKSFTVEAVAASGKPVSYIMTSPSKKITIDSETGKVTVAKKMKKGTYKLKIKAMTTAGAGYKAASDEAEVKIKVKK